MTYNEDDEYDEDYDECVAHRRKHGLIVNDVLTIWCKEECEIEATCPLNPNN